MASVGTIRTALETIVAALDGARTFDPAAPSIEPGKGVGVLIAPAANFDAVVALGDVEDLRFTVTVLTSRASERAAQARLDAFVETLRAALTTGATSDWDYTVPDTPTGYGQYNFGSGDNVTQYLGFAMPLLVAVS